MHASARSKFHSCSSHVLNALSSRVSQCNMHRLIHCIISGSGYAPRVGGRFHSKSMTARKSLLDVMSLCVQTLNMSASDDEGHTQTFSISMSPAKLLAGAQCSGPGGVMLLSSRPASIGYAIASSASSYQTCSLRRGRQHSKAALPCSSPGGRLLELRSRDSILAGSGARGGRHFHCQ